MFKFNDRPGNKWHLFRGKPANPFATASAAELARLIERNLRISRPDGSDFWESRAVAFVWAILKPLVFLRDHHGLPLKATTMQAYLDLEYLNALIDENVETTKNAFGADIWVERLDARFPGIGPTLSTLTAYIRTLPGYDPKKTASKQVPLVYEHHGYITMQLIHALHVLSETKSPYFSARGILSGERRRRLLYVALFFIGLVGFYTLGQVAQQPAQTRAATSAEMERKRDVAERALGEFADEQIAQARSRTAELEAKAEALAARADAAATDDPLANLDEDYVFTPKVMPPKIDIPALSCE